MDYNSVLQIDNGVELRNVKNFELPHIFDCGQCFRWNRQEDGSYIGVAYGKVIEVQKIVNNVYIYNTSVDEFHEIWEQYFDLKRDYSVVKESLSKDPLLNQAVNFGPGIRLLNQEPFEIILSFIISSNNRIPMIKKVIDNICRNWGEKIEYKDNVFFTFPNIEALHQLSQQDFEKCSAGFRGKYLKETIEKIYSKKFDIQYALSSQDDVCHDELKKLSGVGPKVADCIMLFSMGKYSAFPVDVWVKKAMQYFYVAPDVSLNNIRKFGREKFGDLSGFAQQYLFYYARENHIEI